MVLAVSAWGQRSTTPPSWESLSGAQAQVYYQPLPDTDDEDLLAEDYFLNLGKSRPYRVGFSHVTNFTPLNDGRWSVLENGDRIWLMGLHSKGAQGIGVILENVYLPPRGVLYVYNEDQSEVYGPITHDDNRASALQHIPALSGERLVVEYFEPYSERGEGQFTIGRVIHNYRNLDRPAMGDSAQVACLIDVRCDMAQYRDAAKSVVHILTAEGSKSANGVLVNNSGNLEQPYVLTSDAVLEGRTSSLLFEFNRISSVCGEEESRESPQVLTGADIVVHNEAAGLVLLSLHETPDFHWNLYYSGWNRNATADDDGATLFHPGPDALKISTLNDWSLTSMDGQPTLRVNAWNEGQTAPGILGAPLFNSEGQVVGIFSRGKGTCEDFEFDAFIPLSLGWDDLEEYLNPLGEDLQAIEGDDADLRPRDNSIVRENLALFPNPASDLVYVFNGNRKKLAQVRFFSSTGQLVLDLTPEDQAIDISSLASGVYMVEVRLNAETSIVERLIVR